MATKWEINRAVRASDLAPPSRLIMLTLSDMADANTAVIPERHTPSLAQIADETGLGRTAVKAHLNRLESLGWIIRSRPTEAAARLEHERTQYALAVPKPEGARSPSDHASSTKLGREATKARSLGDHALGREATMPRSPSDHLYKEDDPNDLFNQTGAAPQPDVSEPPAAPIVPSPRREDPPTKAELANGWNALYAAYPLKDDPTAACKEYFRIAPSVGVAVLQDAAVRYRDSPKRNVDRTMKLKNWLAAGAYRNTGQAEPPPAEAFARPGLAVFDPDEDD